MKIQKLDPTGMVVDEVEMTELPYARFIITCNGHEYMLTRDSMVEIEFEHHNPFKFGV